ncbi:MAG: Rieske (2Fe-2S) protein [Micrococcales bacterium]
MENNCIGACESKNHKHQELSRKAVLSGLAAILSGIGLTALGATTAEAATKYKVALASQIPVGSAKAFNVSGRSILITQPRAGVFRAFKNQCTHEPVALPSQRVSGGKVMCYQHGATFNADTGAVSNGPARRSLTKYTAVKTGNYIYVTV